MGNHVTPNPWRDPGYEVYFARGRSHRYYSSFQAKLAEGETGPGPRDPGQGEQAPESEAADCNTDNDRASIGSRWA